MIDTNINDTTGATALPFDESIKDSQEIITEGKWKKPILLTRRWAPDLSLDIFPDWLKEYQEELALNMQTPKGLVANFTLAMLGTACQHKFAVCPNIGTWLEPVNIWTNSIMEPGSGKSRVFNELIAVFSDWQDRKRADLQTEFDEQESRNNMYRERIRAIESKAKDDDSNIEEISRQVAELRKKITHKVKKTQLYTGDITVEKLGVLLSEQNESMAILAPESDMIKTAGGMYSKGDSNMGALLGTHSGDTCVVDRLNRPQVHLKKPLVSIGISTQPKTFMELTQGKYSRIKDNGFTARMHFFVPEEVIDTETDIDALPSGIRSDVENRFKKGLQELLDIPYDLDEFGNHKPKLVFLTDEARAVWHTYSVALKKRRKPGMPLEPMKDNIRRLPGEVLRVAGLMHIAEHGMLAPTIPLSAELMQRVIMHIEAEIPHTSVAYDLMENQIYSSDARRAFDWVMVNVSKSPDGNWEFKQRDLQQQRFHSDDGYSRCLTALKELQFRGIVELPDGPAPKKSGRPQIIWHVNPELFSSVSNGGH